MAIKTSTLASFNKLCNPSARTANYEGVSLPVPHVGDLYIGMSILDMMKTLRYECERGVSYSRKDKGVGRGGESSVFDENGVYLVYSTDGNYVTSITYPGLVHLVGGKGLYTFGGERYASQYSVDGYMMQFTSDDTLELKKCPNVPSIPVSFDGDDVSKIARSNTGKAYARECSKHYECLFDGIPPKNNYGALPFLDGSGKVGDGIKRREELIKELASLDEQLKDFSGVRNFHELAKKAVRFEKDALRVAEEEVAEEERRYNEVCVAQKAEMYVAKGKLWKDENGFYQRVPNSNKPTRSYQPLYHTKSVPSCIKAPFPSANPICKEDVWMGDRFVEHIVYQTNKVDGMKETIHPDKDYEKATEVLGKIKDAEIRLRTAKGRVKQLSANLRQACDQVSNYESKSLERDALLKRRSAVYKELEEVRHSVSSLQKNFSERKSPVFGSNRSELPLGKEEHFDEHDYAM